MADFRLVNLKNDKFSIFGEVEKWKPNCFLISLDFALRNGLFEAEEVPHSSQWSRLMNNDDYFLSE